jgi:hypothetical protein
MHDEMNMGLPVPAVKLGLCSPKQLIRPVSCRICDMKLVEANDLFVGVLINLVPFFRRLAPRQQARQFFDRTFSKTVSHLHKGPVQVPAVSGSVADIIAGEEPGVANEQFEFPVHLQAARGRHAVWNV